jgi:ribonuclease P protein component
MPLETLKKRSQFLKVRGGRRHATPAFVLEGKARSASQGGNVSEKLSEKSENRGPRFGFTVTKKLGGAVDRNRIRRRLKAAAEKAGVPLAQPSFDYVVVARRAALDRPFDTLLEDFAIAVSRIHASSPSRRRQRNRPRAE